MRLRQGFRTGLRVATVIAVVMQLGAPRPAAGQSIPADASSVFRDCSDCPDMVSIPAGRFAMGSSGNEPGHQASEGPQREVRVAAFAIGRFAVTRRQWAVFVAATNRTEQRGCEWAGFPRDASARASWRSLGFAQDDSHPVVCVSWNDAQAYARWLSERTGQAYRLPSEAEWEYAARAGSATAYPWGTVASHEQANYGAVTCCSELASGRDRWLHTAPVGAFPPNAFGLYDMHGNAWQWVQDCYADSYAEAPTDGSAHDPPGCTHRVLRGGTWGDTPAMIRSAFRNWAPPPRWNPEWEYRSGGVGFRVARSLN